MNTDTVNPPETATQVELRQLRKQAHTIGERVSELMYDILGLDPMTHGDDMSRLEVRLRDDILKHAAELGSDIHCLWAITQERNMQGLKTTRD